MSRLSMIRLFDTAYPMEVTNDISEHGVKYTQREFIIPIAGGEVDLSVRSYPKNTFIVVEYWDDLFSPEDDGFRGPLVRTMKIPNAEMTPSWLETLIREYGEPTGEAVDDLVNEERE